MKANLLKTTVRLSGLLAAVALASAAHAATIVPDTWYSAGVAGTPVEDGGVEYVTNGNTGGNKIQHILTYFDPLNLSNIGDSLSVSLTFSGEIDTPNTNRYFAFAFYNSGDNRISKNGVGQGNALFNAYRGYRVGMRTAANGTVSPFELRARSGNDNTLANTNTAHSTSFGTGGPGASSALLSDTLYNVTYTITRTSEGLDISFSITGDGLSDYQGSWSVESSSDGFTTTFDTFAITLGSDTVFKTLTLYGASISAIPEPSSTASLVGLGMLLLVLNRRHRH